MASLLLAGLAASPAFAEAIPQHLGVATCANTVCHGSAKPLTGSPVLQNEYVTWSHFDPHANAFRTLRSEASTAMARRLGLGNATREALCLDCHTDHVTPAERGARFHIDDGVGCEACHGASSGWIASHDDSPRVGHADNLKAGLAALESAGPRAAICLDCHLGTGKRMATHALMAAGHPRLGFELDTYTELWRTAGGREHFRRDADYAARKPGSSHVQVWLTGLLESARRNLTMIAGENASQGVMPEFALFNCYSCHRSMKLARWRDDAKARALPAGSLQVQDSALALLAAALEGLDPEAAARLRLATLELHRAAGRGLPAMREAALVIEGELNIVGPMLAREPGVAQRKAMLESIVAAASRGEYPDYAAAEQAAMAVTLLLAETGRAGALQADIDALFKDLRDDERYDAGRFSRILSRFVE